MRQHELVWANAPMVLVEQVQPESPEMLINRARLLMTPGNTAAARGYV